MLFSRVLTPKITNSEVYLQSPSSRLQLDNNKFRKHWVYVLISHVMRKYNCMFWILKLAVLSLVCAAVGIQGRQFAAAAYIIYKLIHKTIQYTCTLRVHTVWRHMSEHARTHVFNHYKKVQNKCYDVVNSNKWHVRDGRTRVDVTAQAERLMMLLTAHSERASGTTRHNIDDTQHVQAAAANQKQTTIYE